jgi:hypothetical protein
MLSLYITQKAVSIFNSIFSTKNSKNLIIDPFTCIVRLSILSFKQPGTKISICDNRISYHEPNILQGTIRWSQGDNREDLHNLYNPIVKALEWYDCNTTIIRHIFELCIDGLKELKSSYDNNTSICHSINYYITTIENHLNSEEQIKAEETNVNNIIYNELKKLWNTNEITIINNILTEMKTSRKDEQESLINALESILVIKEKRVKSIILDNTTQLK